MRLASRATAAHCPARRAIRWRCRCQRTCCCGSPAVDATAIREGFPFDQRGDGFPRVIGGGPDIGALEGVAPRNNLPVPALAPWLVAMLSALLGVLGLRSRRRSA
jgi:hypothetical protein